MDRVFLVRSTIAGLFITSVLACSSASNGSIAPAASGDGGVTDDAEPGEGADRDAVSKKDGGTSGGAGPFDLDLTVREKDATGGAASTLMFVVVRDADTKEVIAGSYDEEKLVSQVKLKKAGVLEKGHRYEIGVKDTWFTYCLDSSANVWYRELPEVTDDVVLDFTVQVDVDEDPRGCEVLHAPVDLPAGTYSTSQPILGVAGNRVSLVVSPSGRVYAKELVVFCDAPAGCTPTTLTHGACEWEETVYPGQLTFDLGNDSGSSTSVSGTATIDPAAQTIRFKGRTHTWKSGSGTDCCDATFDVTLTKTSSSTSSCQ